MSNPVDIFSIMLNETAKANGIDPKSFYRTCDPKIMSELHKQACKNLSQMVKAFMKSKLELEN